MHLRIQVLLFNVVVFLYLFDDLDLSSELLICLVLANLDRCADLMVIDNQWVLQILTEKHRVKDRAYVLTP